MLCSQMIRHLKKKNLYLKILTQYLGPVHTWSQVLSPKYDMDAYTTTLFKGKGLGLVLEVGFSIKVDATLNTNPTNILFLHKTIKVRL